MANYQIYYREITNEYKAEKVGFSLAAFFFGWMWAFYRGLKFQAVLGLILYGISLSYSYLVAGIGEHGLLEGWNQMGLLAAIQAGALAQIPPEEHYKSAVLITLLMFYFGLQGRSWLADQLLQFDFIALGSQKGTNKDDALKVAVAKLDGALEASSEKLSDVSTKTDKFKKIKSPLTETKLSEWSTLYFYALLVLLLYFYLS